MNNSGNNTVNKNVVLLVTTMSSFLAPFMGSSVFIGLPHIGKEFSMDVVLLSWVTTAYLIAAAMFLVPFGKIADIYGRKKIFQYGIAIDIIASFLLIFSFNEMEMIALRIIQGIGAAMIFGTGMAILTSVYPPAERGKALGINVAGVYLGLSLGPVVGGFLIQYFGWRSIFASYLPLELIILALTLFKMNGEWADAKGEKLDSVGSIIYCVSLPAMMYGFFDSRALASELPGYRDNCRIYSNKSYHTRFRVRHVLLPECKCGVHGFCGFLFYRHICIACEG